MVKLIMSSRGKRGTGILIHLARAESGYATLIAVLVLLVLGALVITPILLYMNTGLDAGQTHERRTDELYAADAGVDYALWQIKMGYVPTEVGVPLEFVFPEPINDKDVHVDVYKVEVSGEEGKPAYRIVSVATTTDDPLHPTSTTVESYVTLAYSTISLLDAAITVRENGTIKGEVVGDVICGGNLDILAGGKVDGNVLCAGKVQIFPGSWVTGDVRSGQGCYNNGRVDGTIYPPDPEIEIPQVEDKYWPDADDFCQYYLDDVQGYDYLPGSINLAGISTSKGPLYREGNLDIYNSGGPATLTLDGTIYVTGQLKIGTTNKEFTLDLNGQTIFCEYLDPAHVHPAIDIAEKCTIKGPGCIIAVGDIAFGPNMATGGEDNYVILMSINGWTDLHPQGNFYGAVLGDVKMDVFPADGKVTYVAPQPGDDLDFPIFNTAEIFTYNIYNYALSIQIDKSVTSSGPYDVGQSITYSYVVTNNLNVTLTDVNVVDDVLGVITLNKTMLAPKEQATGTGSHVVTQADLDAGHVTNIATATGTPPSGPNVTDQDSRTVSFDITASP